MNLKLINSTTLSNTDCRNYFEGDEVPVHDWDTICASANWDAAVVVGDFGGPLVTEFGLIGLTSWISNYIDWVDEKIRLHSSFSPALTWHMSGNLAITHNRTCLCQPEELQEIKKIAYLIDSFHCNNSYTMNFKNALIRRKIILAQAPVERVVSRHRA